MTNNTLEQSVMKMLNAQSAAIISASLNDIQTGKVAEGGEYDTSEPEPIAVLPEGFKVESLERFMPPRHQNNSYSFATLESFVRYINEEKQPATRLFVNEGGARAVIDHNSKEAVARQRHTASLPFSYSEDYERIKGANKEWLKQEDFAELCADIAHCILDPEPATLLELAQDLRGITKVTWRNGKRLKDGRLSIEYVETDEMSKGGAKGDLQIPSAVKISVPIFSFGKEIEWRAALEAELRYRVTPAGIGFCIIIRGLDEIEKLAVEEVTKQIADLTEINPFITTK